tara:strand:+ start:726 stop:3848 length:3123 start_codon:yes stop_codon:yes gene_type:complete
MKNYIHKLTPGLYDSLINESLDEQIKEFLKKKSKEYLQFEKLGDEVSSFYYNQFIADILRQALCIKKPNVRLDFVNSLIHSLCEHEDLEYLRTKLLVPKKQLILRAVKGTLAQADYATPSTPLNISSLLTGACDDPQLEHELRAEMDSADQVDILVSFIKWSGLRLLRDSFEKLETRGIPVRLITTSYMGASDPEAVEWLQKREGFQVKVSFDTERTRLHAKAYFFRRNSGFSTAYIGSANMSKAAITSGLEWTMKVTAKDMPQVLKRFSAEFESYWESDEFSPYSGENIKIFRKAIFANKHKNNDNLPRFFLDIKPYPYQERILESILAARENGSFRNLVIAATGTGKTVIAAFDFKKFRADNTNCRLLFIAHRKEILEQGRACFSSVLRDPNFGELLVAGQEPVDWIHVFASVQSLQKNQKWKTLGKGHFDFVLIDEVHHIKAVSYQRILEMINPSVLLGLTATPERMDGKSLLPDFDHRYCAEIRLPEALDEKLLCPFHYFGVSDNTDLSHDRFWKNGMYDKIELETTFTGDDMVALQRLDVIQNAILKYQPELEAIRAVGFCVTVKHAEYMTRKFKELEYRAETVTGKTLESERSKTIQRFRQGKIQFVFTVDVFSEGIDIPEINMVLFLRPTQSLTVFLQQLGRGLRHAEAKDCLTVLDFVSAYHPKYRIDRFFNALLRKKRRRIDKELELDFPNLPSGCNIQLEKKAKEFIIRSIKDSLANLDQFVSETIKSFEQTYQKPLTLKNFLDETALEPEFILKKKTWSEWKSAADGQKLDEKNIVEIRKMQARLSLRTDTELIGKFIQAISHIDISKLSREETIALHYLFWSKKGSECGFDNLLDSVISLNSHATLMKDLEELLEWRRGNLPSVQKKTDLLYPCFLKLHGAYGYNEIKAAFGLCSFDSSGPAGVGVLHSESLKTYIHLVTFKKEEKDFSPTTRYKDYPISREKLHWESQAGTSQNSSTGQNYLHFKERGYSILFFTRMEKKQNGETAPFIFLGPATELLEYRGDRPISMIWKLRHQLPAYLFEIARAA